MVMRLLGFNICRVNINVSLPISRIYVLDVGAQGRQERGRRLFY